MTMFAVVALLAALVGVVSHYRAPGSLYTLALTAFSPYLVLCAVLAGPLFALSRTFTGWLGLLASAAVVLWLVIVQAPAYVAETAPSGGADVVVMTLNMKIGAADPRAVVAAVRSHHVDVLMLEELTPGAGIALRHVGLDHLLPHSISETRYGGAGTGIWSRFPLTDAAARDDLGFVFVTARTTVLDQSVALAALHTMGPYPQSDFPLWQADMYAFPRILHDLPGPIALVGGDFNATPDTFQFREILGKGFGDAAAEAGAGYLPTWPADRWFPPVIAIDHVLTRGAVARSANTVEIPGSDHRALVVSVRVAAGGS